jgi:peptidoglycan/xylan/chitin deacetylase (PgdA/CDA1 family)
MRQFHTALIITGLLCGALPCAAADCPGNPNALGTERVITVDAREHTRIGSMQYRETLPLADKEVVLSFDDGPLPPYTNHVLKTLASECVRATFFIVGRQARAYPDMVRRIYNAGHTVATHSQNHPLVFDLLPLARAKQEVEDGIASTAAALGDPRAVAPFFRVPGLKRSPAVEAFLASRGIMTWSADFPADDWTHISADKIRMRALERLQRKGKGVLLLHDIQPATALALPQLLRDLKARGYRIVHIVPATADRPKTVTLPDQWALRPQRSVWPRVLDSAAVADELPAPSVESFGWPHPFRMLATTATAHAIVRVSAFARQIRLSRRLAPTPAWPASPAIIGVASAMPLLPAPSARSFGVPNPLGPTISLPASVHASDSSDATPTFERIRDHLLPAAHRKGTSPRGSAG